MVSSWAKVVLGEVNEGKILNRVVRRTADGFELEADQRHSRIPRTKEPGAAGARGGSGILRRPRFYYDTRTVEGEHEAAESNRFDAGELRAVVVFHRKVLRVVVELHTAYRRGGWK